MLVLTRCESEKIMIGDGIIIMVTQIDLEHGRVKIGTQAPRDLPVHREEVYKAIKRNQSNDNR